MDSRRKEYYSKQLKELPGIEFQGIQPILHLLSISGVMDAQVSSEASMPFTWQQNMTTTWKFGDTILKQIVVKGPVDGIGGSVKHAVYRNVLSKKIIIESPQQLASYADSISPNIQVMLSRINAGRMHFIHMGHWKCLCTWEKINLLCSFITIQNQGIHFTTLVSLLRQAQSLGNTT